MNQKYDIKVVQVGENSVKVISPEGVKDEFVELTPSGDLEITLNVGGVKSKQVVRHPMKEKAKKIKKNKNIKNGLKNIAGLALVASLIVGAQTIEFRNEIQPLLDEEENSIEQMVDEVTYAKEDIELAKEVVKRTDDYTKLLDHWGLETLSEKDISNFIYAANIHKVSPSAYELLLEKDLVSANMDEVFQKFHKVLNDVGAYNLYLNRSHDHAPNARIGLFHNILDGEERESVKQLDNFNSDIKVLGSDKNKTDVANKVINYIGSEEFNNIGPGMKALVMKYAELNQASLLAVSPNSIDHLKYGVPDEKAKEVNESFMDALAKHREEDQISYKK